ncbi:hypothetical protein [Oceanispirochaeta sp.]|jgi:hypothetical protein|uniref:hypothetical protein n=1 Tax=Oceanispirochaeta sp. TaxID=2035350 RepID=UPI0026317323|nr:hypothetical protein [Oceanispirochaeta sp.]MDA3955458.1 hypothetical protein [Oceanispirochaeta sp.]
MDFYHIQSPWDSPCEVEGGAWGRSRTPGLSLSKWDTEASLRLGSEFPGERVQTVEHRPGRTILTTGERRHVYRQLDEGNIEYDIILREIPSSPVFKIPLEKAGGLSFHKQGILYGHLMREEVRGSYAVYWKEKNNQYKTGKFCHIYRPKIIDTKGRWIWGDLDYDGDSLYITADETWLKNSSYPVTVVPRIGSDSVGAGSYDFFNDEPGMPTVDLGMALNKFTIDTELAGPCTAYYYSYKNDYEAGGFAAVYDGGLPANLRSSGAPFLNLRVPSTESPSWKSSSFSIDQAIDAGSTIWFGLMAKYYYYPYFDEVDGADLRVHYPSSFTAPPAVCGTTYLHSDILLSMYFDYVSLTTWNVLIEGRIKPDEEIFKESQFHREQQETPALTEGFLSSRGLVRLISSLGDLTDFSDHTARFSRALQSWGASSGMFLRKLSYFIFLEEACSLWDFFTRNRGHASEELVIYSPLTLILKIDSKI